MSETDGAVVFAEDVTVEAGETTIFVASGTPDAIQLYAVPQVLDPIEAGQKPAWCWSMLLVELGQ